MTTQIDIINALRDVGLEHGDTVLVHSKLSSLGHIDGVSENDRSGFLEAVYEAFSEVLDIPRGTLVVPTFTHEYARNGVPFVYEESPSEVGSFSEYVRCLPGSLRSVHPINSFCSIGAGKEEICGGLNRGCYGHDSVFDRLIRTDGKMLFLGASMRHMTLKHHMEQMAGLPYVYHKAYFTPAYKEGNALPLPFTACVRYLNGKVENNDCSKFRNHLEGKGLLRCSLVGGSELLLVGIRDAFKEAFALLQQDPCYFLEQPYYETE